MIGLIIVHHGMLSPKRSDLAANIKKSVSTACFQLLVAVNMLLVTSIMANATVQQDLEEMIACSQVPTSLSHNVPP